MEKTVAQIGNTVKILFTADQPVCFVVTFFWTQSFWMLKTFGSELYLHSLPKENLTVFVICGNVCPTQKATATFTTRLPGRHAQRRPLNHIALISNLISLNRPDRPHGNSVDRRAQSQQQCTG